MPGLTSPGPSIIRLSPQPGNDEDADGANAYDDIRIGLPQRDFAKANTKKLKRYPDTLSGFPGFAGPR